MALNPDTLRDGLVEAFTQNIPNITDEQLDAIESAAQSMSDAIHAYILEARVPSGIAVLVNIGTGIGATTSDSPLE